MNSLSTIAFQGLRAEVSKKKRVKGRKPVWKCNVFAGEQKIFLSDWVSIDFLEKKVA